MQRLRYCRALDSYPTFVEAKLQRWIVEAVKTQCTAILTILRSEYLDWYALVRVEIFTAELVHRPSGSKASGRSLDREWDIVGRKTRIMVV